MTITAEAEYQGLKIREDLAEIQETVRRLAGAHREPTPWHESAAGLNRRLSTGEAASAFLAQLGRQVAELQARMDRMHPAVSDAAWQEALKVGS